jgi:Flp pilus assembly pilin Flp
MNYCAVDSQWHIGNDGAPIDSERRGGCMNEWIRRFWVEESGQDIAEYAVMLAVILVIVVGTIRLVGTNSNNVFSSVASSVQ